VVDGIGRQVLCSCHWDHVRPLPPPPPVAPVLSTVSEAALTSKEADAIVDDILGNGVYYI
jgi:hypothetical protein